MKRRMFALAAALLLTALLGMAVLAAGAETLTLNGGEQTAESDALYSVLTLRSAKLTVAKKATVTVSGMLSVEDASSVDVYGTLTGKATLFSLTDDAKTAGKPSVNVYDGGKVDLWLAKEGWNGSKPEALVVYCGESDAVKTVVTEEKGGYRIVCDASGIKTFFGKTGKWLLLGGIILVVLGAVAAAVIVGMKTKKKQTA